jgi:flagellar basal body-associated protein FliL
MSDTNVETPTAATPPTAPKKGAGIIGILLPAVLAAAASFGGAKLSAAKGAAHAEPAPVHKVVKLPGSTVALEPFLMGKYDSQNKFRAMKLSIAVEFAPETKEESIKPLTPRIRDAVLGHLRQLAFDEVSDPAKSGKLREELLERIHKAGAESAEKVLVTDLVVQ